MHDYEVRFGATALKDIAHWQKYKPENVQRIGQLICDMRASGAFSGIGKPEPLKWGLHGYWSRRIDENNRMVYQIVGNVIWVRSCRGHY